MNYILKGHLPIKESNLAVWGKWFENADRSVVQTDARHARISTVFLGIDHRFGGNGPPILFETMVFGGELDSEQNRYSSWDDAEEGHLEMVGRVEELENV